MGLFPNTKKKPEGSRVLQLYSRQREEVATEGGEERALPEHPVHVRLFAHCVPPNPCKHGTRVHCEPILQMRKLRPRGVTVTIWLQGVESVLRLSSVYSEASVLSALCGLRTELG